MTHNRLFLLLNRDFEQIEELDIKDYVTQRFLTIPGFKTLGTPHMDWDDMASSSADVCLYVANQTGRCVNRIALCDEKVDRWPIAGVPVGISVTDSGTVLVTCKEPVPKLVEFTVSTRGRVCREIRLHPSLRDPWHAVQLGFDRFVVSHGGLSYHNGVSRICVVDASGQVTRASSDDAGDWPVTVIGLPHHLALGNDGLIYVADYELECVLSLDMLCRMKPAMIVSSSELNGFQPRRLCFDALHNVLYMTGESGVVLKVTMS